MKSYTLNHRIALIKRRVSKCLIIMVKVQLAITALKTISTKVYGVKVVNGIRLMRTNKSRERKNDSIRIYGYLGFCQVGEGGLRN